MRRAPRSPRGQRRWWPTPSLLLAGAALFVVLGGSALAATGLIRADDLAPGAVTSKAIRNGAVEPKDLSTSTRALLAGGQGLPGAKGNAGSAGTSGSNGANGPNGANGTNGIDGTDGINGTDGTNGIDGTIAPLSATGAPVELPATSPPTTVVSLAVPAGNYVVLAKTEISQTGAGDTVECTLKAGATTLDRVAMKALPALAAIPASMQGVAELTVPSQLTVECKVKTANGSAEFNSLIAIPTA